MLVGTAWSGLAAATEEQAIASPPDLKAVVTKAGDLGREIVGEARDGVRAELRTGSVRQPETAGGETASR
ncbi:MAG: hypothetical protein WA957_17185 [Alteraurantiacibacter sp.]